METVLIDKYIDESISAIKSLRSQTAIIIELSNEMIKTLTSGGCIFWIGNGGSAADAQHLAAELVGRFELNREPLKSIALTTDTSTITAISNDFGFEQVFARQVKALVTKKDLLICISTSGTSKNVVNALTIAKEIGCKTAFLTGRMSVQADFVINIDSDRTCHIQEGHITCGQLLCSIIDSSLINI
jgi:D-sedoheptulose 7-phosphate isomerase